MTAPFLAGFLTGGSLIVAIGAQNAFVLRQGLLRHHVGAVVGACALSDALLILVGVGGTGAVLDHARWALDVMRWLGVAFLLWYASGCLRRAFAPDTFSPTEPAGVPPDSRRSVLLRALALTWLNPHVYLDTVVLIGSVAAAHSGETGGALDGRWWFAIGAIVASIAWFSGLGFGAKVTAPLLFRPRVWKYLELVIGATMILIAVQLAH